MRDSSVDFHSFTDVLLNRAAIGKTINLYIICHCPEVCILDTFALSIFILKFKAEGLSVLKFDNIISIPVIIV